MTRDDSRVIYPAETDPAALRVERDLYRAPAGVTIIALDDPKFGADRERPVRIILSASQATTLARMLRGVLDE